MSFSDFDSNSLLIAKNSWNSTSLYYLFAHAQCFKLPLTESYLMEEEVHVNTRYFKFIYRIWHKLICKLQIHCEGNMFQEYWQQQKFPEIPRSFYYLFVFVWCFELPLTRSDLKEEEMHVNTRCLKFILKIWHKLISKLQIHCEGNMYQEY